MSTYAKNPHKHGRPSRTESDSPTKTLSVRLTIEELASLRAISDIKGEPCGVLMRRAMERAGLFKHAAE